MVKRTLLMIVFVFFFAGCATMGEKEKTGAATGAIVGAAAGGVIGHQRGSAIEGALIGGAAGAVGGSLIGRHMDRSRANNPNHISITRIAEMGSEGVPGDAIIDEIRRTNSVYYLTSEQITYLKNNNVSDNVINYMIATAHAK
jgi:uncharacterized protein YcfJ